MNTAEHTFLDVRRDDTDDLNLAQLPPPRLGRRLRRWLWVGLFVQCVLSAVALLVMQSPWRPNGRIGSLDTVSRLMVDRLDGQLLHPNNPLPKKMLDSITATPGVRFAVIVDADGRVVLASDPRGQSPLPAEPGVLIPSALTHDGVNAAAGLGESVVLGALLGSDGKHRLVVGVADQAAERAMLDGGLAIGVGFLGALTVVLPMAIWGAKGSTDALHELHKAIRRLAKGIQPDPLAVKGDNEIAYLTIAFNSMACDITASQLALREANRTLERRVAERTEQLREANDALSKKNVRLAEVTETALRFTDDVAHEFRTPLTVILEFASIINDGLAGTVEPEQVEHLVFIMDAARDLTSLVDDFLDTSRLRAGRLPVHRKCHTVEELLESAWKMLEVKAAGRDIRLRKSVARGLPVVLADQGMVRRVLINLVVNAIKFSKAGDEVVIEARDCDGGVQIRVVDNGPGLSEADVARLFNRFKQTATGAQSDSKGFGLGLSITAELVGINLGEVSVESRLGKGSVFAFTLPSHDTGAVLKRYFARVGERNHNGRLAVIQASNRPGSWTMDRLCGHLADVTNPRDLQILSDDEQSVFVIGETDDAEAWCERLRVSEHGIEASPVDAPIDLEVIGSWPVAGLTASDLEATLTITGKGAAHCA